MPIWAYVLIAIAAAIFVLLCVVLLRAAFFKPKKENRTPAEAVTIDKEKAVTSLQALVQCKTVSMRDHSQEDEKEFTKLKARLKEVYPHVFANMEYQELSSREILFHLKGKQSDGKHAAIFMAHFDVVPAEESGWKEPAFEGIRKDGVLWGRGTIDTKGTLNGVLRGAEELFLHNEKPDHDFYFAFAGDEETGGGSAKLAVKYFQEHGIEPMIVVDEGGAVVNKVFPGVSRPTALIGTAEKGACALEFHLDGEGGHASAPKPHTPVGKLASLAVDIEKHPFKYHLTQPVKQMFDTLGREAPFVYRIIFANLWLFNPLLDKLTKKSGGQLNALVRTTVALTQMEGSPATNVIPYKAMIGLNSRMMPPDNLDSVKAKLGKIAKKHGIPLTPVPSYSWNPSRISTIDCEGYQKLKSAIIGTWGQEVIVSPYMMTACADAREYGVISDKVYRFSAMKLRPEQLEMIHGDNEQLNDQQIAETVEFYYRLMRSL
jgi:carboxypeptidase PM20D1